MRVTVLLPGVLRPAVGGAPELTVELTDRATLGAALDQLAERFPALNRRLRDETGSLRRYVNFYVDGEECRHIDGADTELADGAEVQVIPSVAGG
ncbi:MoaD/ThiS family protein [Solihabitans fulvus]|uniref:MoaD/ThiS family protein n=1 Tax=Solihabitans fulvus TaxID=1892852 RepID=A0A5B2WTZ6_9PSEU|nr:ubiquitin-like small modifier protein 1 [Solihabitans fulvus]KAA2253899.1 MoaD/ThiS family protein [Solihabitans fulvus]